jgi:hypothetical protein
LAAAIGIMMGHLLGVEAIDVTAFMRRPAAPRPETEEQHRLQPESPSSPPLGSAPQS